jgi:hypothetical protein
MERILDKAREGQNLLEKIANAIPGFKGYREKELRRDADRLQREYLATRLDECKKALNDISAAASRSGSLDVINDIETARKRLDKVANRIRYADRGYAGFFDAIKVQEDALERVYQFDLRLLGGVDTIRDASAAATGAPDVQQAVRDMVTAIDALDASLADRESILTGIR